MNEKKNSKLIKGKRKNSYHLSELDYNEKMMIKLMARIIVKSILNGNVADLNNKQK